MAPVDDLQHLVRPRGGEGFHYGGSAAVGVRVTPRPVWQPLFGLALLVPSLVFLGTSYVSPLLWTVRTSMARPKGRDLAVVSSHGGSNYQLAYDSGFSKALGYAFSLSLLPLLVVLIVAPLLALYAHRAGPVGRVMTRVLLAVPMATFTPVAFAAAWLVYRPSDLDQASAAPGTLRIVYASLVFGVVLALSVSLYLAAMRRRDVGQPPWGAFGVAVVFAVLTTVAVAVQEFTVPFVITGGGPDRQTVTPLVLMFATGFEQYALGPAAAICTMLWLVLGVLGVVATLLVILSRARIEVDETHRSADHRLGWDSDRYLSISLTALLLLITVSAGCYAAWPWLRGLVSGGQAALGAQGATPDTFTNTWLPPLISVLVGVGAAAVGGYGIAVIRPLGSASEWLLLPFAPFLFVGVGPLSLRSFAVGETAGTLKTLMALVPPTRLVVPALVLFTVLFRGLAVRANEVRRAGRTMTWSRAYLRPSLPMVGFVALVTWVVQAQDMLWPALSGTGTYATGPVRLVRELAAGGRTAETLHVSLAVPVGLLLLMLAIAIVFQATYADRLALRVGRIRRPRP